MINIFKKDSKIKIGNSAPNFLLSDKNGNAKTLSDYGSKIKIISTFPAINTKVCDLQTTFFFQKVKNDKNLVVLNVSNDTNEVLNKWCVAKNFEEIVTLSSANSKEFTRDYNLKNKGVFKKFLKRAVFLLDKNNKIVYLEYVKPITNSVNFERLLEELKKIKE